MPVVRGVTFKAEPQPVSEADAANKLESLIVEGANISQLARIFQLDNRTVTSRLFDLKPNKVRGRSIMYLIKDAAIYLCKPIGDFDEALKRMNPADLPPLVTKEYWNGRKARLDYEERVGDLWPTSEVKEHITTAFASLRMTLMLTNDQVERDTDLPNNVRDKIRSIIDESIVELQKNLIDAFNEKVPSSADEPHTVVHAPSDDTQSTGEDPESGDDGSEGL